MGEPMTGSKSFIFNFADVEVREREFSLIKSGEVLPVEPKAFRVLLYLAAKSSKADREGRTAECSVGRCGGYRQLPDAHHRTASAPVSGTKSATPVISRPLPPSAIDSCARWSFGRCFRKSRKNHRKPTAQLIATGPAGSALTQVENATLSERKRRRKLMLESGALESRHRGLSLFFF